MIRMFVTKNLILVSVAATPKKMIDKKDGHEFVKFRHVFMTPETKELIAWADDDKYRVDVKPALKFDPAKAKDFLFDQTDWEGNSRLRLIGRDEAMEYLKKSGS